MDDDRLVRVLKALGDAKRFRMVQAIASAGEMTCGQVGELFELSQPTISHHLKLLVDAGVLVFRQDAQHHFISVNRQLLEDISVLPARLSGKSPGRKKKAAVENPARKEQH